MGINESLKDKREEILSIAAKHGARNIRSGLLGLSPAKRRTRKAILIS
jgi:hypothetical protein